MADPPQKKEQEPRELRGIRPSLRPLFRAIALNGTLAIALLGFPWWRGRTRAEMTAHAYVEYAACLHAGTVTQAPGLALPDGHRERFAALYVGAVPEWPGGCRDALDRIPQDEALFLMPGAKTGEEEVRAAVIGARSALDEIVEARAAGRPHQIPHRLLRTLDHVAAAVSIGVSETGLDFATQHLAFDLGEGPSLVTASRVPLQTAMGGPMFVTARPDGLRVATADGRSAAVIVVHDGTVDITQVRRSPSARALIDDGETTLLGWVTGDATCVHDDAHCAHRLTGLARVREGVSSPEAEVWIAAHPAFALARSFVLEGAQLSVIAREADGSATIRDFTLPEPWPAAGSAAPTDPTEPTEPTEAGPVPLVALAPVPIGAARDAARAGTAWITTEGADTLLPCGARVAAIGRTSARFRAPPAIEATLPPADPDLAIDVQAPARSVDPLDDHARCATSTSGTSFAWLDPTGTLHLAADVEAPSDQVIADHVVGFAMTRTGETVLFATWGQEGERTVTLRRVWHGRVLSSDVAAACWDDGAGLCGPAGLATTGTDTILYARESTDLRVLRVTGAGFAALPGLD